MALLALAALGAFWLTPLAAGMLVAAGAPAGACWAWTVSDAAPMPSTLSATIRCLRVIAPSLPFEVAGRGRTPA